MMKLARPALVLAAAALVGSLVAASVVPALAGNDVAKLEKLKKARDEFRKKQKDAGKFPFLDLTYAAEQKIAGESRWTQTDPPPFQEVEEEKGPQFYATWSPDITKSGAYITMYAVKYIHKSPDGKSKYTMNWKNAGITCDCANDDKMIEGAYLDWLRQVKDAAKDKCVEPKKKKVGPADTWATVWGTNPESSKRERRDFYKWTDSNRTWILFVTIMDKALEDEALMVKAEEFIKTIKESKAPD